MEKSIITSVAKYGRCANWLGWQLIDQRLLILDQNGSLEKVGPDLSVTGLTSQRTDHHYIGKHC